MLFLGKTCKKYGVALNPINLDEWKQKRNKVVVVDSSDSEQTSNDKEEEGSGINSSNEDQGSGNDSNEDSNEEIPEEEDSVLPDDYNPDQLSYLLSQKAAISRRKSGVDASSQMSSSP